MMQDLERAVSADARAPYAPTTIRAEGLKPMLRGYPDVLAVLIAVPAVAMLLTHVPEAHATAALIYGLSVLFLFGVSATYHTPRWSLGVRRWWRYLDHSAIYILIAGSYTPVCLHVIDPQAGQTILMIVWGSAALGILKSFFWEKSPRVLNSLIYVALGWVIVPHLPQLIASAGPLATSLWAGGGVLYTVGALIYARRSPNPWPLVFGYHEVFHIFVVAAGALQFTAMWMVLVP